MLWIAYLFGRGWLFGIAFRYVEVRSKAVPCIFKYKIKKRSFYFCCDIGLSLCQTEVLNHQISKMNVLKKILFLCFIANISFILYLIMIFLLLFINYDLLEKIFFIEVFTLLMSLSSALFIFNNYVCYKKDLAKNGLLLIFGNIFYNPFYYLKIKRLGWV